MQIRYPLEHRPEAARDKLLKAGAVVLLNCHFVLVGCNALRERCRILIHFLLAPGLLLLFLLAVLFGAAQDQDLDGVSKSSPLMTAMELLESNKFPIVYFYTMNENACHKGLPNYLTDSINQAIHTQTECCQV